jgi:threonine dehydrogenase-like Zn-dependent dehydrogenase
MKERILLQLDGDRHPSVFDAVVAVDAGVQKLLQYGSVTAADVEGLVHGCIFTRGIPHLASTAIFVGGSDVRQGEALAAQVAKAFFGPMRVSVMMDASGANTTAAAAVLCAEKHVDLSTARVAVLGGTGPVGQRVARLTAAAGATVMLGSRSLEKAQLICEQIGERVDGARVAPLGKSQRDVLATCDAVFACGAAGICLASSADWQASAQLKVAIDLNAVPPLGIDGIEVMHKAEMLGHVACYGAIGVGGLKMKIHKRSLQRLFESNDAFLDAEEILAIGRTLDA